MVTVVPVDEFVGGEWYPGFTPAASHAPFVVEPFGRFRPGDEERFWFLDFHWPRGFTPLGLLWLEEGYSWGAQLAAETMPLPAGRGIALRVAGTHVYAAAIPLDSEDGVAARAERLRETLPGYLASFEARWAERVAELDAGWDRFAGLDLARLSQPELQRYLEDARSYLRRATEIHFEAMYPLLANHLAFSRLCAELAIAPAETAKFLQGYDTGVSDTDRELTDMARQARAAGLAPVFAANAPDQLAHVLSAADGPAGGWLARFDAFLQTRGNRIEGSFDVALPSWIEDPTPALSQVRAALTNGEHDFDAARAAAVVEREAAIAAARSRLTRVELEAFDAGLASAQGANFPRWQDDHHLRIDQRVALPLRWAALALAERVGADRPDDTVYLFWSELAAVAAGEQPYDPCRALVAERRAYFERWQQRRAAMPRVLGTIPDQVTDPILIEVFGINRHFLAAVSVGREAPVTTLTGVPAARGTARGTARVLCDPAELHRVRPGEILVCESISPSWSPAFARIAGCVCDSGGALSHAAIVGREYGLPTVTACGVATQVIADGDEIEVDGGAGSVAVLRRAAHPADAATHPADATTHPADAAGGVAAPA